MSCFKLKNKRILSLIFVMFTISIFMISCLKDDFNFDKMTNPTWEPNFSLPLIHSKLNLSKVLGVTGGDSLLNEDASHFLTLIYRDNIFSQYAYDVFTIPDQTYSLNYPFSLPGGMNNGDSISGTYSDNIVFVNSNSEILDTMYVKDSILNFKMNTTINQNAKIEIVMPTVTKNGIPLSATINYIYTGTPSNINYNVPIDGYKMVFHNAGGVFNQLTINYKVTIFNIGLPDLSPYAFNFDLKFENLKYSKMYGYMNQKDYLFPVDTLSIDIFKNSWFGNFMLEDPKLKVNVYNSYGFPLNLTFDLLDAYNPKTPALVPVVGFPSPFTITEPTTVGQVTTTTVLLDKNNSNIKDAINITPRYFAYHFEGHANPTGIYQPNFMLDTSSFKVDIELEMPLFGRAWNFVIQDTIDFTFDKIEELVYANFKINILNGFPIDAKMQIYITDSLYNPLDSLFTGEQIVVSAANVGGAPDYRVTTSTLKYTEVNLSQSRLTNLTHAKKMLIRSKLNTTNNGNDIMKIYSDYLIDVRMAVQAQLKVNLNNY